MRRRLGKYPELDHLTPQAAYALYKLGRLPSDALLAAVNDWLNDGVYTDSLNEIFYSEDPHMNTLGPLLEKAITELGIAPLAPIEAAYYVCFLAMQKSADGLANAYTVARYIQTIYYGIHGHSLDQHERWDCLDAGDIMTSLIVYEDMVGERPTHRGSYLRDIQLAIEGWLDRHPNGQVPAVPSIQIQRQSWLTRLWRKITAPR